MTSIIILIVLISINGVKVKCDEASITSKEANETPETKELFSTEIAPPEEDDDKTKNNQDSSNTEADHENGRVLRSDSDEFLRNSTRFDEFTESLSTKSSFAEKNAHEKVISENIKDDNENIDTRKTVENEGDSTKSEITNPEKLLEELTTTTHTFTETEENKEEDNPEEITNNKSSNRATQPEQHSESIDSGIEDIQGNSGNSLVNAFVETRRMFESPNMVLETKARSGEAAADIATERKFALEPNIENDYSLNEFGPESNNILKDHYLNHYEHSDNNLMLDQDTTLLKTTTPTMKTLSSQVIRNQPSPTMYFQSGHKINYPIPNTQLQRITDLPTYLALNQNQIQLRNDLIDSGIYSEERRTLVNTINKNQLHKPDAKVYPKMSLENRQFENLSYANKNQVQQYQNHKLLGSIWPSTNKQNEYLIHQPKNFIHPFQQSQDILGTKDYPRNLNIEELNPKQKQLIKNYQTPEQLYFKRVFDNNHIEDLSNEPRKQIQQVVNEGIVDLSRTSNNNQIEHLSYKSTSPVLLSSDKHVINTKLPTGFTNLKNVNHGFNKIYSLPNTMPSERTKENKQVDTENLERLRSIFAVKTLKAPTSYYDPNSNNFKTLFNKLAEASTHPRKLKQHSYSTNNIEINPYFISPKDADSYTYDFSYISGF